MVFQNYALYPHMNVRNNMGFALKQRGVGKAEIEARVLNAGRMLGLEALTGPQAACALGRPAPTGGHGPRHRAQPERLPVR